MISEFYLTINIAYTDHMDASTKTHKLTRNIQIMRMALNPPEGAGTGAQTMQQIANLMRKLAPKGKRSSEVTVQEAIQANSSSEHHG